MEHTLNMPDQLNYWTADEVAECLSVSSALYLKLWSILSAAENPTPLGGDGSNGTVETPDERLDEDNDDKAPHWWVKLNNNEQREVADAYRKEYA